VDAIPQFDFKGVYKRFEELLNNWVSKDQFSSELRKYKRAVQQEFIIWKELDFSKDGLFDSMQIVCSSNQDKTALLNELQRFNLLNKYSSKIVVDNFNTGLFFNDKFHKKVKLDIAEDDDKINVDITDDYYKGNGLIILKTATAFIKDIDGYISNIQESNGYKTISSNNVLNVILTKDCKEFEVWYNDESNRKWKIYHFINGFTIQEG
jgi:hypothetical protein